MSFKDLGLNPRILDALEQKGYTEPTPIQAKAIPALMQGKDIMGGAQTGTGKTAAFTLPILQKLSATERAGKAPRALILVPTRELAAQVADSVKTYGKYTKIQSLEVYGGVGINPQIQKLARGVDIVIATPGRLLDHMNQRTINLSKIEVLVLDEADRMLDMGFIHDIKKVMARLPHRRQNMLFSATFSKEIKALADKLLNEPELIEVSPRNTTAQTVQQVTYPIAREQKLQLLIHLIQKHNWFQVLVFTKTKHRAHSLSKQLTNAGIPAAAIHGDKSQGARTRALKEFKSGKIQALVATDIAARGIDIDQLATVVNFQLPQVAEDYIHRIGRTGRAGSEGLAVSLISSEDVKLLRGIERLLKKPIPSQKEEGFATDSNQLPEEERHKAQPRHPRHGRNAGGNRNGRNGRDNTSEGGRKQRRPGTGKNTTGQGWAKKKAPQNQNR